jgi:hypothetical protein
MWAADGHEPKSFLLLHTGGMQKHIDHPRWDQSWAVPGTATIDDLYELGFLRVASADPQSKNRTFELTLAGREKAQSLSAQAAHPVTDSLNADAAPRPAVSVPSSSEAADDAPTAFVSWAHEDGDWQATVVEFAFTLRRLGIETEIDLMRLHDRGIDWTIYGPRAIEENDFVLIPVSAGYRRRWEGTDATGTGAGAAREANTLKSLFDEDQEAFRRKVKIVILPGGSVDDIPTELRAMTQRFDVETIDQNGLEHLLRTLADRPEYIAPPVGQLPMLPPRGVGDAVAARPTARSYVLPQALAQLPEREKLVIALTFYEGRTRDEIAEVLGVPADEISMLADAAARSVGAAVIGDLRDRDPPSPGGGHKAHTALLADGPSSGERISVEPGQQTLVIPERFDIDEGYVEVLSHYVYESRTGNDAETVVFRFSHQEHRVETGS